MKLTFQPKPPPPKPFDPNVFHSNLALCGCCSEVLCELCPPSRVASWNMWTDYTPRTKAHRNQLMTHWETHHADNP